MRRDVAGRGLEPGDTHAAPAELPVMGWEECIELGLREPRVSENRGPGSRVPRRNTIFMIP